MEYLNDISYKDCVGKVCKSLNSGDFKIVKYNDKTNVEIQFLKTGYKTTVYLGNIKSGSIKDPYAPSVFGVGIIGAKYPITINGVITKEYALWKRMLERCYSDTFLTKNPTYEGCKCSENFKSYEYFYEWCHSQIGFDNDGNGNPFQLDKDLLIKGNKIYSENLCVFIPRELNSLLLTRDAKRGEHPLGVYLHKASNKFTSMLHIGNGKRKCLGSYNTSEEAFNVYKIAKEEFIKEKAEKYKSQIDFRVYNALMSYEVKITD